MLFSELNQINMNVLIQEPDHEVVPDISSYFVHNANHWTLWHEKIEESQQDDTVPVYDNGWEISSFVSDDLEDSYLNYALTDISANLKITSDYDSDIVKIYAGQFDADGTVNYDGILESEGPFEYRDVPPPLPNRGSWWTFNNGAFQWIGGGPKSIFECRFSYGPFNWPDCHHKDPHHFDNNHKMVDKVMGMSIIQNLVFVFDPWHTLKGIVSLPCINQEMQTVTKKYLEFLIKFISQNQYKLSFKNIDEVLKECSKVYADLPLIKVAQHTKPEPLKPPVNAIFEISEKAVLVPPCGKYIFPNSDTLSVFLDKSCWKTYSINQSLNIGIPDSYNPDPLVPSDDISAIMDHVNALQKVTADMYNNFNNKETVFVQLCEGYLNRSKNKVKTAALVSLSDLFKRVKEIDKIYDKDKNYVIVLPKPFCNKELLQLITDVKYQ